MIKTLNDLLANASKKYGGRPAVVQQAADGGAEESLSYAGLYGGILRAAAAFRSRGIGKGDCVAIVHRNGPEFLTAYFGLSALGAVAVPINFMVQKAEELGFMLKHCGAKGVVTQREFLKGLRKARKDLPGLKTLWVSDSPESTGEGGEGPAEESWAAFLSAHEPLAELPEVGPEDVATILYTSGTTGEPKGVMLTHANLVSNAQAGIEALGLYETDVMLTILPMFHTFAWTGCVLAPIFLGVKNVVVSSLTPPKPWLKQMGRHGVTAFLAVPQLYTLLSKQVCGLKGLILKYWFFRKVRVCVSGAAPLPPQTLRDFREAFGVPITEGYGLTETSPVATVNPIKAPKDGSVGVPVRDVSVRIVAEDGTEMSQGAEGEIQIKGPNVMKGYYHNENATREAISPEGWLKTGDVGVLDEDGYLFIKDRIKDMIIIKGLKVFSAQLEATLVSHPDIKEAAVIGIKDELGDERIKAFVVLHDGVEDGLASVKKFCKEKFDAYKRPREIEILDELPKNALQKVLKRVLRDKELAKAGG